MSRQSSIPPSEPPPSSRIPGRGASQGPYIIGIVAFGAMSVALLLYWKQCMTTQAPPPPPPPVPTPVETYAPAPVYAPPPPEPIEEEEDAGVDAAVASAGGKPRAGDGVCSACGKGISTSTLESKVASQAGLAKGCYNRVLRTSAVSGTLMVSVSVGADGRVCSASIVRDNLGSPAISNCVLGKFRGAQFPRPKRGCVVINVPIAFKTKKEK